MDIDSLVDSKILDAIQDELYRFNTGSSYLNPRFANKNFRLGNLKVKKGDYLTTPTSLKLVSKQLYEDPTQFKLERFLDNSLKDKNAKFDFIPFSTGNRACPGTHISRIV